MSTLASSFPTDVRLLTALKQVMGWSIDVKITRKRNPFCGAFPSEEVTCYIGNGQPHRLFVKYGQRGVHTGHGYWGGVDREAWVYQRLLPAMNGQHARFRGAYRDEETDETWLILDVLDPVRRLYHVEEDEMRSALRDAARWLGNFHAATAEPLAADVHEALPSYHSTYYLGWLERTKDFTMAMREDYPWLPSVLDRAEPVLAELTQGPMCLIHGEFYSANVLVQGGKVIVVDWQSTAIAKGELDLACLLEGWQGSALYPELVGAYQRARWSEGAPTAMNRMLLAARLYWPLRWLGDEPHLTLQPKRRIHFQTLRAAAIGLGLIST